MSEETGDESSGETRRTVLKFSSLVGSLGVLPAATRANGESGRDVEEYDPGIGVQSLTTADDLAEAIADQQFYGSIDSSDLEGVNAQVSTFETSLAGFPTDGDSFGVLSTGVADDVPGNASEFASTAFPDSVFVPNGAPDGYDAFNVVTLSLTFDVPEDAETLSFNYRFGTEENPTYLYDPYQDYFSAVLETPDGDVQLATLPDGSHVTVDNANQYANSPGGSSLSPGRPYPDPDDTVFNSVTQELTVEHDVSEYDGESLTLHLQVADGSDSALDSAVFLDGLSYPGLAGFGPDLDPLIENKRERINAIRSQAESVIGEGLIDDDVFPDLIFEDQPTVGEIDADAEEFLDEVDRASNLSTSEREQYAEALERLDEIERVTEKAVTDPISPADDGSPSPIRRQVLAALSAVETAAFEVVALGAGKVAERGLKGFIDGDLISGFFRSVDDILRTAGIDGSTARRFAARFDEDQTKTVDEVERTLEDDFNDRATKQRRDADKQFVETSAEQTAKAGPQMAAGLSQTLQEVADAVTDFLVKTQYERYVLGSDFAGAEFPPLKDFEPPSVDLPDVPDTVDVPGSGGAENAANRFGNWVDDATDDEIVDIEYDGVDLPEEVDLSWLDLPDEIGVSKSDLPDFDEISELDDLLEQIDELVAYGVDPMLDRCVDDLQELVEEGALSEQDDATRASVAGLGISAIDISTDVTDLLFDAVDVVSVFVDGVELLLDILLITGAIIAFVSTGGAGVLVYLPIVELLSVAAAAVSIYIDSCTYMLGDAYTNVVSDIHRASGDLITNSDLDFAGGI